MTARSFYQVRRTGSIAEVDPAAWDSLAAEEVYARHGWLRTVEETVADAANPVYFLLEVDGELIGAAVCYRIVAPPPTLIDSLLLGRLAGPAARLGLTLGPMLVCAPLIGHGRYLLCRDDAAVPEAIMAALLDAMSEYAGKERLSVAFAKLPDNEAVILSSLLARGYSRTVNWPVMYMDIRWRSLEEYTAALAPGVGKNVRRECAAPEKVGVEIRRERQFGEPAEELFQLIEANHDKYSDERFGIAADFFRSLARWHADDSVVNVARSGGDVTGACLLLAGRRCAAAPLIGVGADSRNRKAFTYFNLAFYRPIRWCIERGVRRLYLGAGLYEMKRRRGCDMLGLCMLIRHRTVTGRLVCRGMCALHRLWAIVKLRRQNVRLS